VDAVVAHLEVQAATGTAERQDRHLVTALLEFALQREVAARAKEVGGLLGLGVARPWITVAEDAFDAVEGFLARFQERPPDQTGWRAECLVDQSG